MSKYNDELLSRVNENTVVEWCSHCEQEIELKWNVEAQGHKTYCPVCGNVLMLCDECTHRCDPNCDECNKLNVQTVKDYNQVFHPLYEAASCFIRNIPHAIEKSPEPDEVARQMSCIGYNEKLVSFIDAALDSFREQMLSKLKNSVVYRTDTEFSHPVKFIGNAHTILMERSFYPEDYMRYALEHKFNVKYTDTSCCSALEVANVFVANGFEMELGVDTSLSPDGVCKLEKVYLLFKHPCYLSSNEKSVSKDNLIKAMQCLADNGIEKDECYNVLQALCYTLMDIEIDDYLTEEDLPDGF